MSRRARVTNAPLPASLTKHVDELDHALPARKGDGCNLTLKQESKLDENMSSPCHSVHAATSVTARSSTRKAGSTGTTGTTLWLGAQIMSVYLETILPPSLVPILDSHSLSNANTNSSGLPCPDKRKRAIELGSGIGYLSLYLASKGYDVLATDIEPSLSSVLKPNIAQGLDAIKTQLASTRGTVRSMGDVIVSEIDWMNSPAIPTAAPGSNQRQGVDAEKTISEPEAVSKESMRYLRDLVGQGLDMIISTDTLYAPVIVEPLWNTIYHLSHISAAVRDSPAIADFPSPSHGGIPSKVDPAPLADTEITHALHAAKPVHPRVYIALENRDPNLISAALAHGTRLGFELRRVPQSKLSKALKDVNWSWDKGEWDGVEVWKGQWKGKLP